MLHGRTNIPINGLIICILFFVFLRDIIKKIFLNLNPFSSLIILAFIN